MVLNAGCRFCRNLIRSMQVKSLCVRKCFLISVIVFNGMLVTEICKNAAVSYAVPVCLCVWIQAVICWNRWWCNVTSSSVASVSTAFHFWLKPDTHNRHFTWRPAWITAHISDNCGLSLHRPGFSPTPVHVGFSVDRVSVGQYILLSALFTLVRIIPLFLCWNL